MSRALIKFLSTFFYIGYLPFMPGTFASLTVAGLFLLLKFNAFTQLFFTLSILWLGFLVVGKAEKIFGKKDPPCVVIDEAAGMLLSLMFLPYDIKLLISALVLFRILDILKPYPIAKVQALTGSLGIMGDDIIAGLYANLVIQIVLRLVSFRMS